VAQRKACQSKWDGLITTYENVKQEIEKLDVAIKREMKRA
jgi:hypothetical protein